MDNYTPSRLRDVSYNGGIYMLPMGYSAIGITYKQNASGRQRLDAADEP